MKNSRVLLLRQQRRRATETITTAIHNLDFFAGQTTEALSVERLMGLEGAGAATYFSAFADCLTNPEFVFTGRSRRPPGNPVNALLSFGYQVLWNQIKSGCKMEV